MKILIVGIVLVMSSSAWANHFVKPKVKLAMCVAVQVCGECYTPPDCRGGVCIGGGSHPCGCHMECLPGT